MPYTVLTGGAEVCELDGYGPITATQARTILARTHTSTPTSAGTGGREVNQGNNNGSARRPGGDGRAGRSDPSGQAGRRPGASGQPGRSPGVSSGTSRRPDTPRGADSTPAAPGGSDRSPHQPTGSATGSRSDPGCDLLVQRLVCDPLDGSLLDATRIAGYVPPEWLAEQIRTRDRTCVAPGCRQPAARTEIDHRVPYQAGGTTSADNLNLLCKHHHRAKDGGGWTLTRTADGTYHWTSPLGRTHTREPETWWQPTDPASDPGGPSAAALSQTADQSATRGTPNEPVASEQETGEQPAGEQPGGTRDSSDQDPATTGPAESLAPPSDQAEPGVPDQNDDLPPF
nr:HNH endonuclease signature motif containing protein [Nakamurella aerolata]